jgi:hypothetical protein
LEEVHKVLQPIKTTINQFNIDELVKNINHRALMHLVSSKKKKKKNNKKKN